MGELAQGAAYFVVFGVVGGVGDGVAAADGGRVVVGVAFVGYEVDLRGGALVREVSNELEQWSAYFAEELLLVWLWFLESAGVAR